MHSVRRTRSSRLDVRPHRQSRQLRKQSQLRKTVAAVQHSRKFQLFITFLEHSNIYFSFEVFILTSVLDFDLNFVRENGATTFVRMTKVRTSFILTMKV